LIETKLIAVEHLNYEHLLTFDI